MSINTFEKLIYVTDQFIPQLYLFVIKHVIHYYNNLTGEHLSLRIVNLISASTLRLTKDHVINDGAIKEPIRNENSNPRDATKTNQELSSAAVSLSMPLHDTLVNDTGKNRQINTQVSAGS